MFSLFLEQLLNSLQSGLMLFLMASGLTLVFGVMGLINLAHGSLYMVGAFACAAVAAWTGSFWLGLFRRDPLAFRFLPAFPERPRYPDRYGRSARRA